MESLCSPMYRSMAAMTADTGSVMVRRDLKKAEGQRKLYSRRKIVIDEVRRLADMRTEPVSAVIAAKAGHYSSSQNAIVLPSAVHFLIKSWSFVMESLCSPMYCPA
jgi:hypothetical protein